MQRLPVSPTKSNLLRIRDELQFARDGKQLLSQKREVLVMELMRLQDDARKAREELDESLAVAYRAYGIAAVRAGTEALNRLARASPPHPGVKIEERSVMGVVVPIVEAETAAWEARYGDGTAPLEVDEAGQALYAAVARLLEVAEIETAIYRLAAETRKTLRRERALENMFIPQYQATVTYLEDSLEEKERESFYQMKLLKTKGSSP